MRRIALIAAASALAGFAHAQEPRVAEERFDDPAKEARVQALAGEITCLVCEGQSVRDSNALFAEDVRRFIRARMREGLDDPAITEALVERYGERVRYRPALGAHSALLWGAPVILLVAGGALIIMKMRRGGSSGSPA